MKVDIWSDICCPFCYIGKRKFEAGLEQFAHQEAIEVVWHSFELDPSSKTQPGLDVYDYLAERKGASREWSIEMHDQVTRTAQEVGLSFNFDQTVIANSFDAHRLIQMAKTQGLGDEAEERLFKAYFTEGKDISAPNILVALGVDIGLSATEVEQMLQTKAFTEEVRNDQSQARTIGISGVPFFVINNQFAVSGAQPPSVFLQGLQQAWNAYEKQNPVMASIRAESDSCSIDGDC